MSSLDKSNWIAQPFSGERSFLIRIFILLMSLLSRLYYELLLSLLVYLFVCMVFHIFLQVYIGARASVDVCMCTCIIARVCVCGERIYIYMSTPTNVRKSL